MFAFVVVIAAGLGVGLLMRGSLRNLRSARLAATPLVLVAAAMQIGAQFVPRTASTAAYILVVISYVVLFVFAGINWRVPGMAFIALGAALNYTVILANRGMPIASWAAERAGFVGADAERLVLRGKHFIDTGNGAHLRWFGDIIPLWRQPSVASIGDLIIWAGLILLIASLVRGPRGRRTKMDPRDEYAYVPPDHVSARAGDVALQEIDLRDSRSIVDLDTQPANHE